MRAIIAMLIASTAAVELAGCGSAAGSLPPQQPPKVTVAPAIEREVRDIDEYTGQTESVQTVEVRPRVSGYLQEIYFEEGGFVKVGDPLFLIDPRTYQAAYDQALAKIKLYEATYLNAKSVRERSEKLLTTSAVTREVYEQNVAAEKEAVAQQHSAEADAESARLNLEFTRINAEIAGRIDRAYVTKGNLVQSGPAATLLTKIVSVDPMYVFFNPDELAYLRYTRRRVAEGRPEQQHVRERHIEATIILADGTVYAEKGMIDFASNSVDRSTGTIQVRAVFPNEKRLLTPGLYVRLQVAAEQEYPAVLVPERAIGTDQSDKFVYVVDDKSVAQRRNVELGTKQGRLRVIKQGLKARDRVIISGGLLVRDGEPVQTAEGKIKFREGEAPAASREGEAPAEPARREPRPPNATHPPAER